MATLPNLRDYGVQNTSYTPYGSATDQIKARSKYNTTNVGNPYSVPEQPIVQAPVTQSALIGRPSDSSLFNTSKNFTYKAPDKYVSSTPKELPGFDESGIGNTPANDISTVNYLKGIGATDEANAYTSAMTNQQNTGFIGGLADMFGNKDLMSGVSSGMSALGTGFDIYDKFFGTGADIRDAQLDNARTQAATNKQLLKEHTDFRKGLVKSGLAANA